VKSPRWRRNQRLKCECGGYHFPHRITGGACDHSPTQAIHLAKRGGDKAEIADAILDYALSKPHRPSHQPCPF
jgi:hypothetical protein